MHNIKKLLTAGYLATDKWNTIYANTPCELASRRKYWTYITTAIYKRKTISLGQNYTYDIEHHKVDKNSNKK